VLSMKSLKKQMKKIKSMTLKDMVTTLVSFYWSVLLGLLHVAFSVARGFCRIFYNTFMGGNLVEGAKTVSELLATMPDPTQDEVRGEGEDREKRLSDRSSPKEDLADLAVNTSETELLSDIFGLDLRREGGQYKITPHNPNATLTELLNSPESAFLKKILAYQRKLLVSPTFLSLSAHIIVFRSPLSVVPLVIFKREKEVARKLEFDGLYITEQPSEDDIKGQWDRLVINTQ
ncbi:hypothetical protein GOODEAATRI_025831, partial [Goodea atripinnis]